MVDCNGYYEVYTELYRKKTSIGLIYEELRGIAGDLIFRCGRASQANRSSLEEDVIGADKVSEDYSKVMTTDFVMSMSRKVEDKIANTGRFHVIKNRFGNSDGLTFPRPSTPIQVTFKYMKPTHKG